MSDPVKFRIYWNNLSAQQAVNIAVAAGSYIDFWTFKKRFNFSKYIAINEENIRRVELMMRIRNGDEKAKSDFLRLLQFPEGSELLSLSSAGGIVRANYRSVDEAVANNCYEIEGRLSRNNGHKVALASIFLFSNDDRYAAEAKTRECLLKRLPKCERDECNNRLRGLHYSIKDLYIERQQ